jgi:nucleoside-diphosphate-sugar epimerase
MHILVTGGAGFIGSHLVCWLIEQGHDVRILDNLSSGRTTLPGTSLEAVMFLEGDILDFNTVLSASRGVDLVFHLAAQVSVIDSIEDPLHTQAVNATGTMHVLEAARQAQVRRVVQASSCAVYGNTELLPISETVAPAPLSPYAITKLAAEHMGQLYTNLYDIETVALRLFNVYGPRQDPASPYAAVIPRFIDILHSGKQPVIYGDGHQSRDFVFVGDIVRALWTAATAANMAGAVCNVGTGRAWSILDLTRMLGDVLGMAVQPAFMPERSGEVRHSCADVSRFEAQSGFKAQTTLPEGLALTVKGWSEQA